MFSKLRSDLIQIIFDLVYWCRNGVFWVLISTWSRKKTWPSWTIFVSNWL